MTKEEIIDEYSKVMGYNGIEPLLIEGLEEDALAIIKDSMNRFAKQQAIEFFKWNASKVSEYMDYLRRTDQAEGPEEKELELNHFEGNTIEGRYTQFIESQNNVRSK